MISNATLPLADDVTHAIQKLHLDTTRPGSLEILVKHFAIVCGAVLMSSTDRRKFNSSVRKVAKSVIH